MKFKTAWKLHSWLGLICGLALLIIGLTGSVLVFHRELAMVFHPDIILRKSDSSAPRLHYSTLIQEVETDHPDFWVRAWLPHQNPNANDIVFLESRSEEIDWYALYVDPTNGESYHDPILFEETLYGWFVALHYSFMADHIGMAIAAIVALCFIGLGVTGLILYKNFWKSLFTLRWNKSLRILFSDLHKFIGIICMPFNLLLGVTGLYWNITHLLHEIVEHADHDHEEAHVDEPIVYDLKRVDRLLNTGSELWQGYEINYFSLPSHDNPKLRLFGRTPSAHPFTSLYGSRAFFEIETSELVYSRNLQESSLLAKLLDAFEPLHFGDFGGYPVKIIYCFVGLSPGILALSGSYLWWTRNKRKLKKKFSRVNKGPEPTVTAKL